MRIINKVLVKVRMTKFRAYSKSTESDAAKVVTSTTNDDQTPLWRPWLWTACPVVWLGRTFELSRAVAPGPLPHHPAAHAHRRRSLAQAHHSGTLPHDHNPRPLSPPPLEVVCPPPLVVVEVVRPPSELVRVWSLPFPQHHAGDLSIWEPSKIRALYQWDKKSGFRGSVPEW